MKIAFLFTLLFSAAHASEPPITCPSACYCDESWIYINCVGDGVWEVPPDIPNTVARLELRNFAIGTLTATHFTGLTNVSELKLQQTHIERIEDGTFVYLSRLVRLDLSQNSVANITRSTFAGLVALRYLDLSSNRLANVSGAFADMENIEQLNLRDNQLNYLTGDTFAGLQRVQYLNLDSNRVFAIDVDTFRALTHLVHLIVSYNPMSNLTRLDFLSARLLYIDISHVGLLRVPRSLTQMVRDLRLAKNNLTRIRNGDFDGYPHLGLLVLDDNQITEIEAGALAGQTSLLRLWLNGNLLPTVPVNLPPALKTLYVEENQLEALPAYAFRGLVNVEQLFLQRNKIKVMDVCAFCDLSSLRSLDLQFNLIESVREGVFANLSQLESLDLSQNPLQALQASCFVGADSLHILRMSRVKTVPRFDDGAFDALKRLEVLELYDSAGFAQLVLNSTQVLQALRNVRELNVMHNNIQSLRQDFLHFFPALREIKLSGNNWHCDPGILWMAQWIKKADVQFYRSYSIRCVTPQELQNKPVMTLTEADFPTSTSTSTSPVPVTTSTTTTTTTELPTTTIPKTNPTTTKTTTTTRKTDPTTPKTRKTDPTTPKTRKTDLTTPKTRKTDPTTPKNRKTDPPTPKTRKTDPPTPKNRQRTTTTEIPTTTNRLTSPRTRKRTTTTTTQSALPTTTTTTEVTTTTTTKPTTFPPTTTLELLTTLAKTEKPVTGSSLPVATIDDTPDDQQFLILVTSLVAGILLVIVGSASAILVYRCHHNGSCSGVVKRNGSISYSPQRDEVSIVTVSEGTFGLKTATHNGLGNKLYFVMDNGKDVEAESDLHELLPPPEDSGHYPYGAT